jgi:8-oxo-dGTP pyrophosphatase MutT (NUDIX family)
MKRQGKEVGKIWHITGQDGILLKIFPVTKDAFKAPLVEIDTADFGDQTSYALHGLRIKLPFKIGNFPVYEIMIKDLLQVIYKKWGKFGPYGDLIQITVLEDDSIRIDFIGHLAWPKPALAADLVPIIRDSAGNLFFVGITRKKDPGKGKPALIGGHLDIKGYHFETAAEALIHEAWDEAGIRIKVMKQFVSKVKTTPNMLRIPVSVNLIRHPGLGSYLLLIGTFATSAEEKLLDLGTKRVFQTTAYAMVIDILNRSLTSEEVAQLFVSGDDAASIYVRKVTSHRTPPFAIKHHRTIYQATLAKLANEDRINVK